MKKWNWEEIAKNVAALFWIGVFFFLLSNFSDNENAKILMVFFMFGVGIWLGQRIPRHHKN